MQKGPKCLFMRYVGGFATKRSQVASFDFYGPTEREGEEAEKCSGMSCT